MCSRIDVWIRANRNTDRLVRLSRDAVDQIHLSAGFNIEEQDSGIEGVPDLLNCLADSGKNHLLR